MNPYMCIMAGWSRLAIVRRHESRASFRSVGRLISLHSLADDSHVAYHPMTSSLIRKKSFLGKDLVKISVF